MSSQAKFCGKCGAALRSGRQFCVECGQAIATATPGGRAADAPPPPIIVPPLASPSQLATERYQPPVSPSPAPRVGGAPPGSPPIVGGYGPMAVPQPAVAPPRIASLAKRIVALLIDSLALFGIFYLVGCLVANTTDDTTEYGFNLEGGAAGVVIGIALLVWLLYYVVMEGTLGATLGKLVMGIGVERRAGGPAGMAASAIRNLLRIVDGIGGYLVGLIVALTSPLRQRIGDRAAGTVVADRERGSGVRAGALIAALALAIVGTAAGVLLRDPAGAEASVSATLARGVTSDFRPVDPTTRFAPTQESFFFTFEYSNVEPGSEFRAVWYAVDVGSAAERNAVIDEITRTAPNRNGSGSFSLRRSAAQWPVGEYKVELYLDGELVAEAPFSVAR
jgi:uncharacterized RDD family membrane protein YckC